MLMHHQRLHLSPYTFINHVIERQHTANQSPTSSARPVPSSNNPPTTLIPQPHNHHPSRPRLQRPKVPRSPPLLHIRRAINYPPRIPLPRPPRLPHSTSRPATKYRRSLIHQWYEGTGDWEPEARGEMRPSVEHIHSILRDEIQKLGGDSRKVVLMGFSQGGAMTLMSSLLWDGDPLGAIVVMSGFMPLADTMMDILDDANSKGSTDDLFERDPEEEEITPLQRAIGELRQEAELDLAPPTTSYPFLSTPVFMGHGQKDQDVEYQHGRRAAELLERMGVSVEFNTYPDLAHWYNSDMLRDIVLFLDERLGL
ncbi:hypothetical protein CEP52_010986 [Fusarium oligoseptatum]|uniref:Phospholipase/carboxylesterase/thioesterase domain-containing protein n=1 Tax=Fusarium oligoseptatum TaxID=2604345 RepID=A0A428T5H3_9HYPO|nr:hypothetical protein CEP52_010986 [Fusarium oligoseptatum]